VGGAAGALGEWGGGEVVAARGSADQFNGDVDVDEGTNTSEDVNTNENKTVTAFLQLSEEAQAEIQQRNQQLRQELQTGNLTRQEARQQSSELRSELNDELLQSARTEAQSSEVTIDNSNIPQGGSPLLLLSGTPTSLIDFMKLDIVAALGSADRFNEVQQQQQNQTDQTTSPGT
jgi:hypothetical protein